jgi:hypothetical protein
MRVHRSLLALVICSTACAAPATDALVDEDTAHVASASTVTPRLLAATFGNDDFGGLFGCLGAGPIDGLPVVFSAALNPRTVVPGNFRVINAQGQTVTPMCATLAPANDTDELRTVLLQGAFGTPTTNEPIRVDVQGVKGIEGESYAGLQVAVTPYSVGQYLVYARAQATAGNVGGQNQCPTNGASGAATAQIVQLAFGSNTGGQFPPPQTTFTDLATYYDQFSVTLTNGTIVHPIALGDMNADNHLELCLAATSAAVSVSIAPNTLPDASGQLNLVETHVALEP